ncbi:unnamed protein product [Calicophoron daubneyi]|uniref:G-protein coupled receptors family 1 profile domain-containing protein n=1 Tax=Calicophoron daubneyi TaxID=300641 RepID=A0AAV2TY11_CALDB
MTLFGMAVVVKNLLHFWMMGAVVDEEKNNIALDATPEGNIYTEQQFQCTSAANYEDVAKTFAQIDFISFAILPYIILFSSNVYIYFKLRKQQKLLRRSKSNSKEVMQSLHQKNDKLRVQQARPTGSAEISGKRSSRTQPVVRCKRRPESVIKLLTALTLIHVCCTLPGTVFTFVSFYFKNHFKSMIKSKHDFLKMSLVMLIFTNNAINFFGYYASCSSFRESFKKFLRCTHSKLFTPCGPRPSSPCATRSRCCCCPQEEEDLTAERVQVVATKPYIKVDMYPSDMPVNTRRLTFSNECSDAPVLHENNLDFQYLILCT